MASISNLSHGRKAVQFVAHDGSRKTVHLGKASAKQAEAIKRRIEDLNAARIQRIPLTTDTSQWVGSLGETFHERLARAGLVSARVTPEIRAANSVGGFVDAFLATRADLKPTTRRTFLQTRLALVKFFGEWKLIDTITAGDAEEWAAELRRSYSPASIATFIKRARQMFGHAVKKKLLGENAFLGVRVPSQVNKAREEFISRDAIAQVIDAAPDAEWRLIIALARYGGLRTPSEALALKWTDIDWERSRFTVFSSKLEHLPSGGIRVVPMFPELRPFLENAFHQAAEGNVHVIERYRDRSVNLRTHLYRIIRKAGLQPWGRLFHNMRGSRETELVADFPVHVVAHWLGNTPKIAAAHYLQVRESDIERAAQSSAVSLQNPVQQPFAGHRSLPQEVQKPPGISRELQVFPVNCAVAEYPRQESNL